MFEFSSEKVQQSFFLFLLLLHVRFKITEFCLLQRVFSYLLFRSRSLSRLPNSVVFLVKRKEKKGNSPLSILHARAVSLLALVFSFLPSIFI